MIIEGKRNLVEIKYTCLPCRKYKRRRLVIYYNETFKDRIKEDLYCPICEEKLRAIGARVIE